MDPAAYKQMSSFRINVKKPTRGGRGSQSKKRGGGITRKASVSASQSTAATSSRAEVSDPMEIEPSVLVQPPPRPASAVETQLNWTVYSGRIIKSVLGDEAENGPTEPVEAEPAKTKPSSVGIERLEASRPPWAEIYSLKTVGKGPSDVRSPSVDTSSNNSRETPSWLDRIDIPKDATPPPYPHPNLSLPHLSLSLSFRGALTLQPQIVLANSNLVSVSGGSWTGHWGHGAILPHGQVIQDIPTVSIPSSVHITLSHMLQTSDTPPAYLLVRAQGYLTQANLVRRPPTPVNAPVPQSPGSVPRSTSNAHATSEERDKAPSTDPKSIRLFINIETSDTRYIDKINGHMWLGSGIWKLGETAYDSMELGRGSGEIVYDAYRVS